MAITVNRVTIIDNRNVQLSIDAVKNGVTYQIDIDNVQDLDGNVIDPALTPRTFVGIGTQPQVSSMEYVDITHVDVNFDSDMADDDLFVYEGNYLIDGPSSPTVTDVVRQTARKARLELGEDIVDGTYSIEVINVVNSGGELIDADNDTALFVADVDPFRDHATLSSGLVAYYKMDGNFNDAHTNGIDGTPINSPGTAPTQMNGSAMAFVSSSSQYANLESSAILDNLTECTIAAWYYETDHPGVGVFRTIAGRKGQISLYLTSYTSGLTYYSIMYGTVYKADGTNKALLGSYVDGTLNAWNLVIMTYGSGYINFYRNDSPMGSTTFAGPMGVYDPTRVWKIGATQNISPDSTILHFMKGYMDEIAIWDRVLTTQERTDLYNSGAGLFY